MKLEARYQCNIDDYLEAQSAHARKSRIFPFLMALTFVLIAIGLLQSVTMGLSQGAPALGIGVFWLACGVVFRPMWFRRDFRRHPNFAVAQVVVISEDGLETKCEIGASDTKWSAYSKFRETRNLFMLYMGARLFRVIPKRALSAAQVDELRALLRNKLRSK
jgi:hypothetical protein